jgi:hypothetical protein
MHHSLHMLHTVMVFSNECLSFNFCYLLKSPCLFLMVVGAVSHSCVRYSLSFSMLQCAKKVVELCVCMDWAASPTSFGVHPREVK